MRLKALIFILIASLVGSVCIADTDFDTEYNIEYLINKTGETQVTEEITIINKKSDVIASNYTLTIRRLNPYDIEASNAKGKLDTEVETEGDSTNIKVLFENEVIGEGRKNTFKIKFKTRDIASKVGEVWNVSYPQVQLSDSTKIYRINLIVPIEFGPEIFVSPKPTEVNKKPLATTYVFDKETINSNGISASFGKYQIMNFNLKYQLYNESNLAEHQTVALPPDMLGSQQVSFRSISTQPESIKADADGNYIASFKVGPKQKLQVTVIGSVRITGKQISVANGGTFKDIPNDIATKYTKPQKYWEVDNQNIKALAQQLLDPSKNVAQNAQNVYTYVTKRLTYDLDLPKRDFIERNGALVALTTEGKWACMEFTDSFIALARAMGIPAREIDGYALTTEKSNTPLSISLKGGDLLHSWAEFYDPNLGWVQIDPTWGTTSGIDYFTKLDTNHFSLAVKGINSEIPLPAGSYRYTDSTEKLISVDIAQAASEELFNEKAELIRVITLNPIKYLLGQRKYQIKNVGEVGITKISTGPTLLPIHDSAYMYAPEDTKSLEYTNFFGALQTKEFPYTPLSEISDTLEKVYIATCLLAIPSMLAFAIIVKRKRH